MFKKGFTLVEMLIVITILAIVCTILVTSLQSFSRHQALERDTESLISLLEQARKDTTDSQNAAQYGVHFTTTSATYFVGPTYSAGASTNQVMTLNKMNTMAATLTGGGADVLFNRIIGDTSQNGTVVITSSATGKTKTVTIYKTGLVE